MLLPRIGYSFATVQASLRTTGRPEALFPPIMDNMEYGFIVTDSSGGVTSISRMAAMRGIPQGLSLNEFFR